MGAPFPPPPGTPPPPPPPARPVRHRAPASQLVLTVVGGAVVELDSEYNDIDTGNDEDYVEK